MQITTGKVPTAIKAVIYGPEGIGKSTFASKFPKPLFIDTEGSTKYLDVSRLPDPSSWAMLVEEVEYVRDTPGLCQTLVIDTADWAEMLCIKHILSVNKWISIETPGYGKGYVVLQEEFGRLLNLLSQLIDRGINVLLTAHAQMRKFEQPDELGAYDRWELKLQKKTAPMVKEWADLVLFANYKTMVVNVDGQGATKGKNKAQGGQRVMYTTHHPAWDAKNRMGLQEELPFEFSSIAKHIPAMAETAWAPGEKTPVLDTPIEQTTAATATTSAIEAIQGEAPTPSQPSQERPESIPDALWQLMQKDGINVPLLQYTVYKRGYFPMDTPIANYGQDFINGVLIGAWAQVRDFARTIENELPF